MLYYRNIHDPIKEALKDTPVVLLNGVRQSGKSTFVKQLIQEGYGANYVTLDDLTTLNSAKHDPEAFLSRQKGDLVIDEVQRAPELFIPMKKIIDADRRPGRFLLTGSTNLLKLTKLADSLAGRMEIQTIWPLSQGELRNIKETFLDTIFEKAPNSQNKLDWETLAHILTTGGYPEIVQRKDANRQSAWFKSYLDALIQKDIRELANIEGIAEISRLVSILANRVGSLLNFSDLSRTAGIPVTSLKRYLVLLQNIFLIVLLPGWYSNKEKRITKSPKIYFCDSGLLSYLLKTNADSILANHLERGAILENFVLMEIIKQISWNKNSHQLFHFRTPAGREVDIVIEGPNQKVVGIEVKASTNVQARDFAGLEALKELLPHKFVQGIVLYTGEKTIPFSTNMSAVPLNCLWC